MRHMRKRPLQKIEGLGERKRPTRFSFATRSFNTPTIEENRFYLKRIGIVDKNVKKKNR